jgi:hypothetical protein
MLLFASISSIFRGSDSFLLFNHRFIHVHQTVPTEKMSDKTLNKIDLFYNHMWTVSHGFNEQREVLSLIPLHLRIDALKERFREAIENSVIFKNS